MSLLNGHYLKSADVRVYPCAFRGQASDDIIFDPESRINTEANFILPKANGDLITSYIISFIPVNSGTPLIGTLCCVIGGYYFKLNNFDLNDLNINTATFRQLFIKTREVSLTPNTNENQPKTKVLASFDAIKSSTILDWSETTAADSIFLGLYIADPAEAPEHAASLDVIEYDSIAQTIKIKEASYLPKILHGLGKDSLVLAGGSATGENAIAHGNAFTLASGKNAIALGLGTDINNRSIADGENSITLGNKTIAQGNNSIAGGNGSSATGINSIAIGNAAHADGANAIAFGENTSTSSSNATAFGLNTKATKPNSFVIGSYNRDLEDNDLFVVGDGSDGSPSNAFIVNTKHINLNHPTTIIGNVNIINGTLTSADKLTVKANGASITGATTITCPVTSSDKLTVGSNGADITGNVNIINGTLTSAKKLTISSDGADIIGDVTASGTLSTGNKLTVGSGGADIKGTTRITGSFAVSGAAQVRSLKATVTDGIGVTAKSIEVLNELKIGNSGIIYIAEDGSLRIRIE